jgi:small subunit ribosomal protein S9
MQNTIKVGRRKTSVARVFLKSGDGTVMINNRPLQEYFPQSADQKIALSPLSTVEMLGKMDVHARVNGGGRSGQVGAVRHAIARALLELDEELKPALRRDGHLTRDSRMVERKKYGQKKARKRFQFSKR